MKPDPISEEMPRRLELDAKLKLLELICDPRPDARFSAPAQYTVRLREGWVSDDEGRPLLTKRCPSLQELDAQIDAIKAELDLIQKLAHQRWGDQRHDG